MRVVVGDGEGEAADLELRVADEDATVGDLLDALQGADLPKGSARSTAPPGSWWMDASATPTSRCVRSASTRAPGCRPPAARPANTPGGRGVLELRVVVGLDAGRRMPLGNGPVTVGRDDDCDLVLLDEGVSRRHVQVAPGASGLRATVTDLGSINGTWVEGKQIERETELSPDQLFEAGDVALAVAPVAPGMAIDPLRQARRDGTIPFNCPPRGRSPEARGPLSPPERPPCSCCSARSW